MTGDCSVSINFQPSFESSSTTFGVTLPFVEPEVVAVDAFRRDAAAMGERASLLTLDESADLLRRFDAWLLAAEVAGARGLLASLRGEVFDEGEASLGSLKR